MPEANAGKVQRQRLADQAQPSLVTRRTGQRCGPTERASLLATAAGRISRRRPGPDFPITHLGVPPAAVPSKVRRPAGR